LFSFFSGGIVNTGTINVASTAIGIGGRGIMSSFGGGITNTGTIIGSGGIVLGANIQTFSGAIVNSGNITGTGGTAIDVSRALNAITVDQEAGAITGNILLSANADQLNISGGTIAGNIVGSGFSDTINFNLGSGTFTYGAAFGFSNIGQVNIDSGTVVLNGVNNANNININGGTLAGTGTLDFIPMININSGGTLAPGTPGGLGTLTVEGQLNFNAGSYYAIDIAPGAGNNTKTVEDFAANLGGNGTVVVTPLQLGHYNSIYQILTVKNPAELSGKFAGLTVNGNFSGAMALDYTTNPGDVDLDTNGALLLTTPSGATVNEQNVLNAINNAILAGDAVPNGFNQLLGLSGATYLNAVQQLDGEDGTGAERGAFDLMNGFLGLMLDPFVDGRGGSSTNGGALGFAPDQQAELPPDVALAYASVLKAPPPSTFSQRWSTWASGFGGSSLTDGDPTVGSNNVTTSTYGYAAGMDYHVSPDTVVGFSLAGGGTNWNLANALGTGRSDAFLAGVYGVTHNGPWYLAGALAFANNWFTTSRTALGDQLTASFDGQSYAARLEGGYRFAVPADHNAVGVTPYAAIQAQDFHTPAYSETDLTSGGFGLSYNAMNGTDTRSELGGRFDDLTALNNLPLILRAKVAWAHDWVSNPALNASFESLPGSSFTVFGTPIPHDSALTSAGAQLFFTPNWSLLAKFDGEFASGYQLYAGSGTLRYTW
jgi:uncharacterized protein with beta-barrel porin domain